MNKKWGFLIAGIVLLVLGVGVGVFLTQQTQTTQQEAAEPIACVENQATCAWDSVAGASSYNYQIIDVASGGQVANGVVNGTTQISFTMAPGRQYKCTVAAVSTTCGVGPEGQAQATCIPPTGVPTSPPTNTPSSIPSPTPTPAPTVPPSTTPTGPIPTIPPSICPAPSKVTNIRIICPNCSTN